MMLSILGMILPAVLPVLSDGVRGIFSRLTGGAGGMPVNVDERIKLMQAETEKLRVMADLDRPAGEVSRWVADFRACFRYIAILVIWIVTGIMVAIGANPEYVNVLLELSGMCMSFVIGERFYLKWKAS